MRALGRTTGNLPGTLCFDDLQGTRSGASALCDSMESAGNVECQGRTRELSRR